jgi:lipoprotein-anchoring transpeptidase ErfK/SrfK
MKSACVGVALVSVLLCCPVVVAEEITAQTVAATVHVEGLGSVTQTTVEAGAAAKTEADAKAGTGGVIPMSVALTVAKDLGAAPLPPRVTLTLKVDLSAQKVAVVESGKTAYVWAISSGREGYATQTGTFQPQWTAKIWYSRQWDMAPMPHAVFFNKGTAFHATEAVGALGRPASHGCIRLSPANAAKLYALVQRHGLTSTKVVVTGAPKEPAVARRNGNGQKNWQAAGYQAYAANGYYQTSPRSQRGSRPSTSLWGF